ncbi:MAG: helix-turn-helix transcriptional regulator [Candidatus Paceibacterota bacterium]|jgi:hypothetical protein
MTTIFEGSFAKCLTHFAQVPGEAPTDKHKKVAAFTGVGEQTVRRWFNGRVKPMGESLTRLMFYLELHGYEITELEVLSPPIRDVAQIYAFRILSLTEIVDLVGYPKEGRVGTDSLYRVFHGKQSVPNKRMQKFATLAELYKDQIPEKQRGTVRVNITGSTSDHKLQAPPARVEANVPVRAAAPLQKKSSQSEHEAIIASLAGSVKALIPLAQMVSSDGFTAEERTQVRELAGNNSVFTLANLLYRLCGERAREMHSNPAATSNQKGR